MLLRAVALVVTVLMMISHLRARHAGAAVRTGLSLITRHSECKISSGLASFLTVSDGFMMQKGANNNHRKILLQEFEPTTLAVI